MQQANTYYGTFSILLHWIVAIAMVVSFLTGEALEHGGQAGDEAYSSHVFWSIVFGVPILLRIVWRIVDGFKDTSEQSRVLHIVSRVVMVSFLFVTAGAVLTGLLLPWSAGQALTIGSVALASPVNAMPVLHNLLEQTHGLLSHLWIPLLILHVLGALKHAFYDRDGVFTGIFWPQNR